MGASQNFASNQGAHGAGATARLQENAAGHIADDASEMGGMSTANGSPSKRQVGFLKNHTFANRAA